MLFALKLFLFLCGCLPPAVFAAALWKKTAFLWYVHVYVSILVYVYTCINTYIYVEFLLWSTWKFCSLFCNSSLWCSFTIFFITSKNWILSDEILFFILLNVFLALHLAWEMSVLNKVFPSNPLRIFFFFSLNLISSLWEMKFLCTIACVKGVRSTRHLLVRYTKNALRFGL